MIFSCVLTSVASVFGQSLAAIAEAYAQPGDHKKTKNAQEHRIGQRRSYLQEKGLALFLHAHDAVQYLF